MFVYVHTFPSQKDTGILIFLLDQCSDSLIILVSDTNTAPVIFFQKPITTATTQADTEHELRPLHKDVLKC